MKTVKYYKILQPIGRDRELGDNTGYRGDSYYTSWYNKFVNGSFNRKKRYREYDIMDNDCDISLALDYIAEEMCGNTPKGSDVLKLEMLTDPSQNINNSTLLTLKAALRTFTTLHELDYERMFNICRSTIKYGDTFYLRSRKKNGKWTFVSPYRVNAAIVDKTDSSNVKGWVISTDFTGEYGQQGLYSGTNSGETGDGQSFKSSDVIRFSLCDETSEEAPFGMSVLRAIYRDFRKKELLEDAIVIYRIQRAPERRVIYVDVGRSNPNDARAILNNVKKDFRQGLVPTTRDGKSATDTIYNPQSMQEEFFMAVRPNSATRIETLPGGQNLGNLDDLHLFFRKIWRGLKIPESYINTLVGDGGRGIHHEGKIGIAMMQEIKFSMYVERLQTYIEKTLDEEFKRFIYDNGLNIDPGLYRIRLSEPSNFKKYREAEVNDALINTYNNIVSSKTISARFAMRKYLQLSDDELALNEKLLREEKGLPPEGFEHIPKLYYEEGAEAGGFEGGFGGAPSFSPDLSSGGMDLNDVELPETDTSTEPDQQPPENQSSTLDEK